MLHGEPAPVDFATEVQRREALSRPALVAALTDPPIEPYRVLQRNVSQHAKTLPPPSSPPAAWRAAQKAERLQRPTCDKYDTNGVEHYEENDTYVEAETYVVEPPEPRRPPGTEETTKWNLNAREFFPWLQGNQVQIIHNYDADDDWYMYKKAGACDVDCYMYAGSECSTSLQQSDWNQYDSIQQYDSDHQFDTCFMGAGYYNYYGLDAYAVDDDWYEMKKAEEFETTGFPWNREAPEFVPLDSGMTRNDPDDQKEDPDDQTGDPKEDLDEDSRPPSYQEAMVEPDNINGTPQANDIVIPRATQTSSTRRDWPPP